MRKTLRQRLHKPALSLLLWTWGGTVYFFCEVIYKTLRGRPEQISWTMLLVAIILCIPLERFGEQLPWEMPLALQALICAAAITATELAAGLILNVWLGMDVWDYSNVPLNLWGQICLPFCVLWYFVAMAGIVILDFMRYWVQGGEKPAYKIF